MYFSRKRQTLESLVRRLLSKADAEIVETMILPCAGLAVSTRATGRNRVGGAPLAPLDFAWPRTTSPLIQGFSLFRILRGWFGPKPAPPHPAGRPLAFIIQVDVATLTPELREHLNLPAEGMLSFFHDLDRDWPQYPDRHDDSRLFVFTGDLKPASPPGDLVVKRRFGLSPLKSNSGWMAPEDLPLDEAANDRWSAFLEDDAAGRFAAPGLVVGGWPVAAQGSIFHQLAEELGDEMAQTERSWRLVLQIGAQAPGLKWLGDGQLYVLIETQDLAARRWDQAWVTMQYA